MKTDGVLMSLDKMDFYQLLAQPVVTMITAANAEELMKSGAQLLDVRTQKEFDLDHHPQAMNLPLHLVYLKSLLLDKNKVYITYSSSEERARTAAYFLNEQGFKVYGLQSGINTLYRDIAA
jgi:rhodanese-related sulfurtransferase